MQINIHDKYRSGFALGTILYLLMIIGVGAGVLFSGYSQILRSGQVVTNSLYTKNDMIAALNTLSAESTFSADALTFCPPRSVTQTSGNPCASAPTALTLFGAVATADLAKLPTNYVNAGNTGNPAQLGVFAGGSGIKNLDSWGRFYIYCRWENSRSNPASPAITIISAGPSGNLQTACGDASASGDNQLQTLTVGAAINRSSLLQASATGVSYGATGSRATIDNNGNISTNNLLVAGSMGINNASPTTKLDIATSYFNGITLRNATSLGYLFNDGNMHLETNTGSVLWINGDLNATTYINQGGGNTNINAGSGNVGIGTSNPRFKLEINGQILNTSAYNANGNLGSYDLGVASIGAGTSIYSYGNICAQNAHGDCSGSGGVVIGNANSAANINLTSGTSFFNGGNVGIATTNPQATLDINGSAKLGKYSAIPFICNSSHEGGLAYINNGTIKGVQFCDGANWRRVDGWPISHSTITANVSILGCQASTDANGNPSLSYSLGSAYTSVAGRSYSYVYGGAILHCHVDNQGLTIDSNSGGNNSSSYGSAFVSW